MHPQDHLLVAEALIAYAGDSRDLSDREARAWELTEQILATEGLSGEALITQIDEEWAGPTRR